MESLGLQSVHSIQFAVRDLRSAQQLFEEKMGFTPLYRLGAEARGKRGEDEIVYGAGKARFVATAPLSEASESARYLALHPQGVMRVSFRIKDVASAFRLLESRGGTPTADPVREGGYTAFDVTTPLGEVQFRFVENAAGETGGAESFAPGYDALAPSNVSTRLGWQNVDHLTVNLHSMKPFTDWLVNVLGMEQFWQIQFHTAEHALGKHKSSGSGLKSLVMWDKTSEIKIATNEALRPFFSASQIEKFVADNRGAGVQHIAVSVPSILNAVDELKSRGLSFLAAPQAYYDHVPKRFAEIGFAFDRVKEPVSELQKRNILIDGSPEGYMLQIFTNELGVVEGQGHVSPAFFEVIQRAGDRGFGYGNFRALFEAIELAQTANASAAPSPARSVSASA